MIHSRNKLLEWAAADKISQINLPNAVELVGAERKPSEWIEFLKISLLWLAVISLSSGVIFYFAYNWIEMSRFTKFGLIESGMLLLTLGYIRIAKTPTLTTAMLMGMVLLTGGLLALVGQTYQTGADPWQLFAFWGLLMLPWTIIARASSLWIVWIILINLALSLYLQINNGLLGFGYGEEGFAWIFFLLNNGVLIMLELGRYYQDTKKSGLVSLIQERNRYAIQFATVAASVPTVFLAILPLLSNKVGWEGLLAFFFWIVTLYYVYRFKIKDLFVLTVGASAGGAVFISLFIWRVGGFFLLIGFVIIGLSTLVVIWLKSLAKEFNQERQVNIDTTPENEKTKDAI